jgi:hypothetical protein
MKRDTANSFGLIPIVWLLFINDCWGCGGHIKTRHIWGQTCWGVTPRSLVATFYCHHISRRKILPQSYILKMEAEISSEKVWLQTTRSHVPHICNLYMPAHLRNRLSPYTTICEIACCQVCAKCARLYNQPWPRHMTGSTQHPRADPRHI